MILLQKSVTLAFNLVLHARNHTPGFGHIRPARQCCALDIARGNRAISYEPGYTQMRGNALHTSSPTVDVHSFGVCGTTESRLQRNFERFGVFQGSGFSFVQLHAKKMEETEYSPYTSTSFVFSRDFSKLLCISVDGWVYPMVTRFVSLNSKPDQGLFIGWDLWAMKCREEDGKHIIGKGLSKPVDTNLLCEKDVELTMVGQEKFFFQLPEKPAESIEQYRTFMSEHSAKLAKHREEARHSGSVAEFVCYAACLSICVLFSFSVLKALGGHSTSVSGHRIA